MYTRNMKRLCFAILLAIGVVAAPVAIPAQVGAINIFEQPCEGNSSSPICESAGSGGDDITTLVTNIINTLLFLSGIIAVVFIIIGGVRYTIAQGDSGQIASAKNTIMYAVIGLVVAMAAFAIVNFVISRL